MKKSSQVLFIASCLFLSILTGCATVSERTADIQIMHYNNFLLGKDETYSTTIKDKKVSTKFSSDLCSYFTKCPEWFEYYIGDDTRVMVIRDKTVVYKKNAQGMWIRNNDQGLIKEVDEITKELMENIKKRQVRALRERSKKISG